MDPSLLEQFLGPSSTQFQLPALTEDENDELHPLVSTGFQRLSLTRKSLPGKELHQSRSFLLLLRLLLSIDSERVSAINLTNSPSFKTNIRH